MAAPWWRGATLYQIYPRSFLDADGDGVGDLAGVRRQLDHVAELSVDGVWLSPFYRSPMRDFGYDVSDYRDVDPLFGTLPDFDALLAAAHARGLRVVIDQVYAHCSSDHPWFAESRLDREGSRADWFVWAEPRPDGAPPNNWQAWFGGPAWTWEPRRRQYYLHNFLPSQPQLNFHNPRVQEAVLDVARFWLDRGVDGFRLDVANYYFHDVSLADNPPSGRDKPALPRDLQAHARNANQPETIAFLRRLRALADSHGDRMLVGELAPGSYELMAEYTAGQDRLHTAYAFDFLGPWPGPDAMAETLLRWLEGPDDGWPAWAFSNHDVERVATRWGAAIGATPDQAARLFLALLVCLRGTLFLYQGEELGLPQADVPFERLRDPWGIAGWPAFKGRDGCRTPMPWTSEAGGGFSTAEPWLPVDPAHLPLSVERQRADAGSVLAEARRLLALRRASAPLRLGAFSVAEATREALVIDRIANEERLRCAFNFTGRTIEPASLWGDSLPPFGYRIEARR